MIRVVRGAVTVATAAVAAVGLAGPALASNEVRVMVDPLDWTWSGTVKVRPDVCVNPDVNTVQGLSTCDAEDNSLFPVVDFTVNAGRGPQQVLARESLDADSYGPVVDVAFVISGVLSAPGVPDQVVQPVGVVVRNPMVGSMSLGDPVRSSSEGVRVEVNDLPKFTDPALDKAFYELKFFPSQNAPVDALMNLHKVQQEDVEPEDCTHAVALSPGDRLIAGDGNDTVCVTLKEGDGSSDGEIVIDTGDGNDTVLLDGETDADVEVDAGRGDDVVVVDTDALVEVVTGEGSDAVVDGGSTTIVDVTSADALIPLGMR